MRSVAYASVPERPRVLHDLLRTPNPILQLSTDKLRKLTGARYLFSRRYQPFTPANFGSCGSINARQTGQWKSPGSIGTPGSSIPQPLFCSDGISFRLRLNARNDRARWVLAGLLVLGVAVFGIGINWGWPSHQIDPLLFGSGPDAATNSLNAYRLSGVGIDRLAGESDESGNLAADVAEHPIVIVPNPLPSSRTATELSGRIDPAGGS